MQSQSLNAEASSLTELAGYMEEQKTTQLNENLKRRAGEGGNTSV